MKIYCDGAEDCYCYVFEGDDPVVESHSGISHNVGEYIAVIEALKEAVNRKLKAVEVYTDSLLVVEQVNCRWKVKQAHLLPYRDEARDGLIKLEGKLTWVGRDDNIAGRVLQGN